MDSQLWNWFSENQFSSRNCQSSLGWIRSVSPPPCLFCAPHPVKPLPGLVHAPLVAPTAQQFLPLGAPPSFPSALSPNCVCVDMYPNLHASAVSHTDTAPPLPFSPPPLLPPAPPPFPLHMPKSTFSASPPPNWWKQTATTSSTRLFRFLCVPRYGIPGRPAPRIPPGRFPRRRPLACFPGHLRDLPQSTPSQATLACSLRPSQTHVLRHDLLIRFSHSPFLERGLDLP